MASPALPVLSRLIQLLRLPSSTTDQVRETLRLLVAHARERGVLLQRDEGTLTVDGTAVPPDAAEIDELLTRLEAHGVRRLLVRQHATAAELLQCARLLTETPLVDDAAFEHRVAQLKLWHVALSRRDVPEE